MKSDRQRRLKSVNGNPKSQPKQFLKYVSDSGRKDNIFIKIKVDDHFVTEPKNIAEAFANQRDTLLHTKVRWLSWGNVFTAYFNFF
jgi:hypothetical protein